MTVQNQTPDAATANQPTSAARIEALDWLRGLMALSIMLFHLGAFNYLGGPFDAATGLGRLGIYGVSIFFVLSGLSMAIGYDRYLSGVATAAKFFARRIFRIWPLLWLAVTYAVINGRFEGKDFSAALIIANMTTLFGFVRPYAYINMGAWSIGNEMVYYAVTPLFLWAYHRRLALGNVLTAATIIVGLVFAFALLDQRVILERQWRTYINPFNNMFLYSCGIAIYYNFRKKTYDNRLGLLLIAVVGAAFFLYPATGDQIGIVTGINRVAFSAMAVAAVFLAYTMPPRLPAALAKPMEQLGVATYGVYLLHPIVISILTIAFAHLGIESEIAFPELVIILTIAIALLSFRYFELPLINLGKRLTGSARRTHPADEAVSARLVQQEQL